MSEQMAFGFCGCGCGQPTTVQEWLDRRRGLRDGDYQRFLVGHHTRKSHLEYVRDENGCWLWQRSLDGNGYGKLKVDGRLVAAHRVYFERANGPIPDGLELDHTCYTPACVNPAHLEAVSHAENLRRRRWARRPKEMAA